MSDNQNQNSEYIGTELELFARAKNWKKYWSSKIVPLLGESVLEVGAGIGSNLRLLKQTEHKWTALEPDSKQAIKIKQECQLHPPIDSVDVVVGTLQSIETNKRFNSIIYIDVLEHIEDDRNELTAAFNLVNSEGRLIILSPAHQQLFSPFDKLVGHYRRYSKQMLRKLIPENSRIESLYYLDSIGYIASWRNAKVYKSGMPTRSQIWLWDSLMVPISTVFDKITGHHLGKTIVLVLKKSHS